MSELIDRERFSADMRDFQNRVGIWRDEAENTETRTRADAALATIIETKLILDKQPTIAAPRWHMVEEGMPEEEGRYFIAVFYNGKWLYNVAWFVKDIGDILGVPGSDRKSGFVSNSTEVYPDCWMMPIEPPKEENDGN